MEYSKCPEVGVKVAGEGYPISRWGVSISRPYLIVTNSCCRTHSLIHHSKSHSRLAILYQQDEGTM